MRSLFRCVAAVAALLLIYPAVAQAQWPQKRDGWWFGIGTGVAVFGYGCDGCDTLPEQPKGLAPTLRVRIGGTFTERMLLGLQADLWVKNTSGTLAGIVGTVFYFYPKEPGGFFFGGGFGHMGYTNDDGAGRLTSNGFGLLFGVGRDYRIGRNISLTPVLNASAGGFGVLRRESVLVGRAFSQRMIELGVGLTIH